MPKSTRCSGGRDGHPRTTPDWGSGLWCPRGACGDRGCRRAAHRSREVSVRVANQTIAQVLVESHQRFVSQRIRTNCSANTCQRTLTSPNTRPRCLQRLAIPKAVVAANLTSRHPFDKYFSANLHPDLHVAVHSSSVLVAHSPSRVESQAGATGFACFRCACTPSLRLWVAGDAPAQTDLNWWASEDLRKLSGPPSPTPKIGLLLASRDLIVHATRFAFSRARAHSRRRLGSHSRIASASSRAFGEPSHWRYPTHLDTRRVAVRSCPRSTGGESRRSSCHQRCPATRYRRPRVRRAPTRWPTRS